MSAFLVSPSTLAIVTVAIDRDKLRAGDPYCAGAQRRFGAHGIGWADQLELAAALYDMNVRALKQRYPDSWEPMVSWRFLDGIADILVQPLHPNPYATIKAMDSLVFQCSEGDVPESNLYDALVYARDRFCRVLVCAHPDYESADTWR